MKACCPYCQLEVDIDSTGQLVNPPWLIALCPQCFALCRYERGGVLHRLTLTELGQYSREGGAPGLEAAHLGHSLRVMGEFP